MEGHHQVNGSGPPGNGQQPASNSAANLRMPTVHDALPFTPLSSIIPFSPDIIQPPAAKPTVHPTAFSTYDDVNKSKVVLDQLSAGATNAEAASRRCLQSIEDVQRLLDPNSLTQYTFKKSIKKSDTSASTETPSKKGPSAVLKPFAKMVLDNAAVPFRYLTPDQSPEPQAKQKKHHAKATNAPLATPQSFDQSIDHQQNGLSASQSAAPPSSSQQRQVSAVMPKTLSKAQRAEYQYMPDQDSTGGAQYLTPSKPPTSSANRNTSVAERQQGDAAVNSLQNLLSELFQAEDQIQPDTSGSAPDYAIATFEIRDTDDGSRAVLRREMQLKLESAIFQAVRYRRLADIETEDLIHAQRLCEISMGAVSSLSFSIGDDWTDQDTSEWLQHIMLADTGLSATRTLIKIMAGGAHLKELQSESYLSQIISSIVSVIEHCLIPIVEQPPHVGEKIRGEKGGPPANSKFVMAFNNRQPLQKLLNGASRVMRYLGELLDKTDFDESALSQVEYLCKSIIFAENASVERDSAIGIGPFESMRQATMNVYAKIFTKYTNQRQFILDEVLESLEKLPATKQSARKYTLRDSKPIQLVSALLMRLVQTSATMTKDALKGGKKNGVPASEADVSGEDDSDEESASDGEGVKVARKKPSGRSGTLLSLVQPLHQAALINANHIVTTLIRRALGTSKSSDEPYRKLLDIFTEDFLNVLGSSDWPAAEMLLRTLVGHMIKIVEDKKRPALSRTLALELLGVMGSGIIELQMTARQAAQSIDTSEGMGHRLKSMVEDSESGAMETRDLVAFDGPYRIWAEYLDERGADEDAFLQSAHGYMLMQWAYTAAAGREGSVDSDADETSDIQSKLKEMLLDPNWLDERSTLRVGTSEGRLAVLIATLHSKFCKAFQKIFQLLLSSMASENATVKSRSQKSIATLLEKDPGVLDRNPAILNQIFRCATDNSSLVRESAMGLVQKCVTLRPRLDSKVYTKVIERTGDTAIGVRKRAMKMLKEIYLRNPDSQSMRSAIADTIMVRIEDTEESVVEIARSTMEEIWFQPFYATSKSAVDTGIGLRSHAALVIATVDREDKNLPVLEGLIRRLVTSSKSAGANLEVCRALVCVFFDGIIDNNDIPGAPAQSAILRSLTIFAKATPTLFTASQLERLEPYTQNLTKSDELEVYRYVITILRHVMPNLSMMKTDFLAAMQSTLLTSSTRLHKKELREVAPCLWTINKMLGNIERLINFMASVVNNIYKMRNQDFSSDTAAVTKVTRLMVIASEFGNACDFDGHSSTFKSKGKCEWFRGDSVPALIVETLCSYASPKQPVMVRRTAIEGICTVAQAWPKQFLRADVINALETVFKDRIPETEVVLLAGLESFFVAQEKPDENAGGPELPAGIASGTERLGRTYVASDTDGASTSLAQRFLADIHRIALASFSDPAFIAARLLVSVNKQGLVHPKESGPALVALETCPNTAVASEAFKEHKAQHQKHESLFEKEYMRAVQQTFEYQAKVIGSPLGYLESPPSAKMNLTYEVLKAGKAQVRKKFLTNISQKIDFDPAKLDLHAATPTHLAFVRFCCENLAFFEYDKVEDLLHLLQSLEKIFSSTGSAVAQAIESDVLKMDVDNLLGSEGMANGTSDTIMTNGSSVADVDPARLRQLSVSAQIISIIWETRSFLRRVWNMQKYISKPAKGKDKDANKTPNRASNAVALGEAYVKRIAEIASSAPTDNEHEQRSVCATFVELLSVDHEVKVNSDNEENLDMDLLATRGGGYESPSEGSSSRKSPSVGASGGGRGRKRKGSTSAAGTPRKRGRPRKSVSFNAGGEDEDGGWG